MIHSDLPKIALSIRQPWPWAIIHAGKPVENRTWKTNFRGDFCIHSSKAMPNEDLAEAEKFFLSIGVALAPHLQDLPRGGIVAVATLTDCVTEHDSPWFFGPFGFVLANVRPVEFIPVSGAQGFFNWRARLSIQPKAVQGILL